MFFRDHFGNACSDVDEKRYTAGCAAGVSGDLQNHCYFLQTSANRAKHVAQQFWDVSVRYALVIVAGKLIKPAVDGMYHNPTPGPHLFKFLNG
ncbi:MAG: hypothetical protein ACK5TX_13730 [Planctomyces sp.]